MRRDITLLGLFMIGVGLLSTLHFGFQFQNLFQEYLKRYEFLFEKGLMGRCLSLDVMMFLYISSLLFKNFYYVIGGILFLYFVELGRELGLLASFIALLTEASFRLTHLAMTDFSGGETFSLATPLLFLIGISIPLVFIYFLNHHTIKERLQSRLGSS